METEIGDEPAILGFWLVPTRKVCLFVELKGLVTLSDFVLTVNLVVPYLSISVSLSLLISEL